MRRAFDLGITHFDLANNYGPPYGSAEETFGAVLASDLRPFRDEPRDLDEGGLRHVARAVRRSGDRGKHLLAEASTRALARMGLEYVVIF